MVNQVFSKIAIIGAGKMGDTIISGLLSSAIAGKNNIIAVDKHEDRLRYIELKHGITVTMDTITAVKDSDVLLFCVKPQNARQLFEDLSSSVSSQKAVMSIMAGVTISKMENWLPHGSSVIRVMPNTPAQVGEGMSAIATGTTVPEHHLQWAVSLFSAVGRTIVLEEKHFDAVTGLSASGPAFIYIAIEALADGGVKSGLPRDVAIQLASQMTLGAAKMVLETGKHPAILKDDVTTPAGCTTDGILALEEGGMRVTLIKAVTEATRRACELG
jgi:pyrroline-5-carboxylate reductase